jgi:glycosyltransferase involved in cell wall biosynthesis
MALKIILHQRILAHYRLPIYTLIAADPEISITYIAGQSRADDPKLIPWNQLPSIKFRTLYLNLPRGKWLCWQVGVIRWLLSNKFDALIMCAEPFNLTSWIMPLICWLKQRPAIVWTNFNDIHENGLKFYLRSIQLRPPAALLLYSNVVRQFLIQKGFNTKKLFTINNSLDFNTQRHISKILSPQEITKCRLLLTNNNLNAKLIVHIGRLIIDKKLEQLLNCLYVLKSEGHIVYLALIGDGPQKARLLSLANRLGINDRIYFCDALYDEKLIATHIKAADLAVFPGNGGLPVIHCMTYGIPAIIHSNISRTQTPEVEAVVDDQTGDHYEENDIGHMTAIIKKWLYGTIDRISVQRKCIDMIEQQYTPEFQLDVIRSALTFIFQKRFDL